MPKIDFDGSQISYTDTGNGEPVVAMHCSSAAGSQWDLLNTRLGDRYRMIAPDQWDCGESDPWPGRRPFTLAGEALPITQIIDSLDEPVHLIGHSYGGAVALKVACLRPQRLKSLVLVEPSSFHLLRQSDFNDRGRFDEISAIAGNVNGAVLTGEFGMGLECFVDYWNGSGFWSSIPSGAQRKLCRRFAKVPLDFRALFVEENQLDGATF